MCVWMCDCARTRCWLLLSTSYRLIQNLCCRFLWHKRVIAWGGGVKMKGCGNAVEMNGTLCPFRISRSKRDASRPAAGDKKKGDEEITSDPPTL